MRFTSPKSFKAGLAVKLFAILLTALFFSPSIWAKTEDGTGSTGGGNLIKSAFRLRATGLIAKIAQTPAANNLCSSQLMQNALDSSKVLVVDTLIDRRTGSPPEEANLEAWTQPGEIQLLRSPWERYLTGGHSTIAASLEVLILHEVYRSTGICNDEEFHISKQIPATFNTPQRSGQVFRFIYNTKLSTAFFEIKGSDRHDFFTFSTPVICDKEFNHKKGGELTLTCAGFGSEITSIGISVNGEGSGSDEEPARLIVFRTVLKAPLQHIDDSLSFGPMEKLFESARETESHESRKFTNLWTYLNKSRPFYFVYDLDTATIGYGYNLEKLKILE